MDRSIRGEYWITDCGEVLFADGDIGPDGHETHVLAHARTLLLDALDVDSPDGVDDARAWFASLGPALGVDPGSRDDREWAAAIRARAMDKGRDTDECMLLFGVARDLPGAEDPRDVAMREWGWIWVRGNDVALWALGAEDSSRLRRGLSRVLDEEGIDDPGAEYEMEFTIRLGSSGKRFVSTIDGLRAERHRAEPGAYDMGFPAARMAERMDREAMAPCYCGVIGD